MPPAAKPADNLSIISLAAGLVSVILLLFSIMPLLGMCFAPLSVLFVLTAIVSGIASLIRLRARPELDGRLQALTGLGLSLVWALTISILLAYVARH